jgi:hypothetical protein
MTEYKPWFQVVMLLMFTVLTLRTINQTHKRAVTVYQVAHAEKAKKEDFHWLKSCTLHVKGIPIEDRAGMGLKATLERFL